MGEVVRLSDRPKKVPAKKRKATRQRFGSIRKLPSGRWQARYTAPNGERVNGPVTFQTKGDAQTWLALEDAAITEGRWRPELPAEPDATTLDVYATRWLATRELKERTRDEYRKLLDKVTPEFTGVAVRDITAETVKTWYAQLDAKHPTERAHRYALLRTVLGSAVEDGLLAANPCTVRGAGRAKRVRQIRPATLEELATITDAMPEGERLLVSLAGWCALRFGELTELRRRDVDVKGAVIRIRRAVTWVSGIDPDRPQVSGPVVGSPKSEAGIRDVHVPPHLIPAVRNHLAEHVGPGPDALLFHAQDGGHLSHGTLYKHFVIARAAGGREDLRLHDLRHTGAVMAAQAGATTKELMSRLGHSTVTMAMNYQHAAAERDAEIARRLSEMMTDPKGGKE